MQKLIGLAILVVVVMLPGLAAADAFDALRGKTIRFIIGSNPHAGTDNYARPFIEKLEELLPETRIRTQLTDSGLDAMALMEAAGSKGSAITVVAVHISPIYSQMMASKIAEFDLMQFKWIGALTKNQRIGVVPKVLALSSFDALKTLGRQPLTAAENAGTPGYIEGLAVSAMTDLGMKVVGGVSNSERAPLLLAGKLDFVLNSYVNIKPLIDSGDLIPVLRIGQEGYPAEMASIPTLRDVVPNDVPDELVAVMEDLDGMGRLIAAAPNTDEDVLDALRLAFDRIVADPETRQIYDSRDLFLSPTSGAEVQANIGRFLKEEKTRALLVSYYECGKARSDDPSAKCN